MSQWIQNCLSFEELILLEIITQIFRMSGSIEVQMTPYFESIQIGIDWKSTPKINLCLFVEKNGFISFNAWSSNLNRNTFFCSLLSVALLFTFAWKTTDFRILSTKFSSDSKLILPRWISLILVVSGKWAAFSFCSACSYSWN